MSHDPVEQRDGGDAPDRYLWDGGGPVDSDVAALERALQPLRYAGRAPALPARRERRTTFARPAVWGPLAAAAALALALGLIRALSPPAAPADGWKIASVTGGATIDADPAAAGRLEIGRWLETGSGAEVRVRHDEVGSVTVGADSRLRLVAERAGAEHRIELARGSIEALITAPPRLFFVDTASAVAVDLGCAYRLEVDESGDGLLEVLLGWVALERQRYIATVPMGGACRLRAGLGPGTPWFTDASPRFRDAVQRFDEGAGADSALADLLEEARPRDTMTLWHLLPRVDGAERRGVADRMIALAGPPDAALEAILGLEADSLRAWWNALEPDWY